MGFPVSVRQIRSGTGITTGRNLITLRHNPLMCYIRSPSGDGLSLGQVTMRRASTISMGSCAIGRIGLGTFSVTTTGRSVKAINGIGMATVPCCT